MVMEDRESSLVGVAGIGISMRSGKRARSTLELFPLVSFLLIFLPVFGAWKPWNADKVAETVDAVDNVRVGGWAAPLASGFAAAGVPGADMMSEKRDKK